jgi:hypothetical protein
MARLEVLEGTWEELATHAEKLKGRRLRVIILPPEAAATEVSADQTTLRETAIRLFSAADTIERAPGEPSSDPHEKAFGEIVAEKYRKMGLKV